MDLLICANLAVSLQDDGKMKLSMDEDKIIWPGGLSKKPTGLMIPTHLKVLTIADKPFVYHRKIDNGEMCDASKGEILCPHYNTEPTGVQRCKLYSKLGKGPYFYYVRKIVGEWVHPMLIIAFLHFINWQFLAQICL